MIWDYQINDLLWWKSQLCDTLQTWVKHLIPEARVLSIEFHISIKFHKNNPFKADKLFGMHRVRMFYLYHSYFLNILLSVSIVRESSNRGEEGDYSQIISYLYFLFFQVFLERFTMKLFMYLLKIIKHKHIYICTCTYLHPYIFVLFVFFFLL